MAAWCALIVFTEYDWRTSQNLMEPEMEPEYTALPEPERCIATCTSQFLCSCSVMARTAGCSVATLGPGALVAVSMSNVSLR